jgi:hypothetical protein
LEPEVAVADARIPRRRLVSAFDGVVGSPTLVDFEMAGVVAEPVHEVVGRDVDHVSGFAAIRAEPSHRRHRQLDLADELEVLGLEYRERARQVVVALEVLVTMFPSGSTSNPL